MSTATVSAFIDSWHPKKDKDDPQKEVCAVSIRVTFMRQKKYYPTGINLPIKAFTRIVTAKRRSEADRAIYNKIRSHEAKANKVIEKLSAFTFQQFEKMYVQNRGAIDSVSVAFDECINELKSEGRIGTAVGYECAKNSLEKFRTDMKFADITKTMLTKYENWMNEKGNSKTTISMYLRCLRALFNRRGIDSSLYPFSRDRYDGKFKIPTGRNIKKALSIEEVGRIFNYKAEPGSNTEMARDYWVFIYLCNGINVKDLCLLKRKNIDGDFLSFERAKTEQTRKDGSKIRVSLKAETKVILNKWGQRSISPDSFVFPHLHKGLTPAKERQLIQQLTQLINKHMKLIAIKTEIKKVVTTYVARHSFATVLKRSGASTEFISEALGHSDLRTTKNYLASFEQDTVQKTTDALTAFAK